MSSTHNIPLQQAIDMTKRYRDGKAKVISKDYDHNKILPLSETFSRDAFDAVLLQNGCTGIRVYFSMDEGMRIRAIIVGTNANNEDILPASVTAADTTGGGGGIIEEGNICPPNCPPHGPLHP